MVLQKEMSYNRRANILKDFKEPRLRLSGEPEERILIRDRGRIPMGFETGT